MRPELLLAAVAASGALAACTTGGKSPLASATPAEREFVIAVETWDRNHDGSVTCDEWSGYVGRLFQAADANRDGVLTREEFAAMARSDRLFETVGLAYFDADGDGRITRSELVDKPNPAFTLLDKNQDCTISPDERMHLADSGAGIGGARRKGGRHRSGGM